MLTSFLTLSRRARGRATRNTAQCDRPRAGHPKRAGSGCPGRQGAGAGRATRPVRTLDLSERTGVKTEGGTVPAENTPDDVARTQQRLRILQWATPVLTGALVVLGAQQGEQERPSQRIRSWRKNAG
jgi:hypothetical protein